MLYYSISYHMGGNLHINLTSNPIYSKTLDYNSVLVEIHRRDCGRPTRFVIVHEPTDGDYDRKEMQYFMQDFNSRSMKTPYKYKMVLQ